MLGRVRPQNRREQRLCEFGIRNDHRAGAGIFQDVQVIALGVGGVGWNRDAARRHDGEIGQAPFGPVFRYQHDPVAVVQAHGTKAFGDQTDRAGRLVPAQALPCAIALGPEKWPLAAFIRPREEQRNQIVRGIKIGKLHRLPFAMRPGNRSNDVRAFRQAVRRLLAVASPVAENRYPFFRAMLYSLTARPSLRGSAAPRSLPSTASTAFALSGNARAATSAWPSAFSAGIIASSVLPCSTETFAPTGA